MQENAAFRVTTSEVLVSAPVDYFDSALLESCTKEWSRVTWVVGNTMGSERADMQVGDLLLRFRVAVLVEQGSLEADGSRWKTAAFGFQKTLASETSLNRAGPLNAA